MANGQVLRGEMYWVCLDDSIGSEQMTGRPAVVISGDKNNEVLPTVIVAYVTSKGTPSPTSVSVKCEGEPRRVLCNQVRTLDKQRLTRYLCRLNDYEMSRVTGALASSMCIPLAVKNEAKTPDAIALELERDMWKRLYDMAMGQLVEIKMSTDFARRMETADCEHEEEPEIDSVEDMELFEEKVVDINHCTFNELRVLGFSANVAMTIIAQRPYQNIFDIKTLPGMSSVAYQLAEKRICCTPPEVIEEEPPVEEEPEIEVEEEPEEEPVVIPATNKVNINTATAKEISEAVGVSLKDAYAITGYRKKNGLFVELEELLEVSRISRPKFEKIKDSLTIGDEITPPEVIEEEPPILVVEEKENEKVNVNTANCYELMGAGFGKSEAAKVVKWVKSHGKFKSLDDLVKVDGVTGKLLRKIRDNLEV